VAFGVDEAEHVRRQLAGRIEALRFRLRADPFDAERADPESTSTERASSAPLRSLITPRFAVIREEVSACLRAASS
jgi:hypothetical protein